MLSVLLGLSPTAAQDSTFFELRYEVHRNKTPGAISKEKLIQAITLSDLKRIYPTDWIKEYRTIEVSAYHKGKLKKAIAQNDTITQQQMNVMRNADAGTSVAVTIRYLPDNNLKENEEKEFDFSFLVDPAKEATFPGGNEHLAEYITAQAKDNIPTSSFRQHHLTAVKFTIDEEGQVTDAHIYESSKDETTDGILLETVCNMPLWVPAQYANGTKTKQEFVLLAGDMNSCVINYFSVGLDRLSENNR